MYRIAYSINLARARSHVCAAIEQTRRDANEAELAELRTQLRAANVASHKASAVQPQHCSEVNDCACHSVSEQSSLEA